MNEVIEAKFEVVVERTPEVIATEIRTIEAQVYEVALTGAVKIGNRLQEIKDAVGHGNWYEWIEEHLGYSKRQAQRFMEIADKYGDENSEYFKLISKTTTSSHLSISKALALLKVPENEVEDFAENHNIEDMKVKELEEEIKKLKAEKEKAENKAESISELSSNETRRMAEEIGELKKALEKAEQEKLDAEAQGSASEDAQKDIDAKQAEIEKLTAKLDKAKAKAKKLEEEKKSLEEGKEKELQTVKEKAMQEAMDAALEKAKEAMECALASEREKTESALQRAEQAEKNLENANSEIQMKRKVNMQLIQSLANELKAVIDTEPDAEKKKDMLAKSRGFISAMADIFKEA